MLAQTAMSVVFMLRETITLGTIVMAGNSPKLFKYGETFKSATVTKLSEREEWNG